MKKIYLIHGWGGSPEEPMHKWIKKKLEDERFEVAVPEMPNTDEPKIDAWISKIESIVKNPDKNVTLIGHSIGCQAILRYLETLNKEVVKKVILVAPWMCLDEKTIEEEGEEVKEIARPWVETPINWKKVKKHSDKFVCIFSDNDYYVPLSNQEMFKKELNAEIIIQHEKGHFTKEDNVKELPIILELCQP
ncbi:alpha/beta fold hydrolase [Candidatus Woesearchaeota archaeon]|nr:alpha/beta fold hydrolase [Candidatus Woesearchaeota archaeon]